MVSHRFAVQIITNYRNDFYDRTYEFDLAGTPDEAMEMEGEAIDLAIDAFIEDTGHPVGEDATHVVSYLGEVT